MSEVDGASLSSQEIIERGMDVLQNTLPEGWEVKRQEIETRAGDRRDDAMLLLQSAQQGLSATILAEAKKSFAPRDVNDVLGGRAALIRQATGQANVLVIAPWLSERSRALLASAKFNYIDLTGNVRLVTTYPAVFIERLAPRQGGAAKRRSAGLRGPKAGRVVRLLADVAPPYGVLELAQAAGVTPGYVSKLLEWLDREAIVQRSRRGGVQSVDWPELLRRRIEAYSVFETNQTTRFVCPNGPGWALEQVRDLRSIGQLKVNDIALTGSFAVEQIVSVAAPTLLVLYTRNDAQPSIEESARLIPADEGANVVLATPYDDVIFERPFWASKPLKPLVQFTACAQLVLDSLTGTGRMPAEGEALMTWMAEDESRWRKRSLAETGTD